MYNKFLEISFIILVLIGFVIVVIMGYFSFKAKETQNAEWHLIVNNLNQQLKTNCEQTNILLRQKNLEPLNCAGLPK